MDGMFLDRTLPVQLLQGRSDVWLVLLSVLIAAVSAGIGLRLAQVAQVSKGLDRRIALFSGSLVLGCGIWSMHFIGMLAFDLCLSVQYDLSLTLLSMAPSLLAAWMALRILARTQASMRTLVAGGLWVGLGIAAMHYSGMAAMQMAPVLRYDALWFAASLLVGVGLSTGALWLRFAFCTPGESATPRRQLAQRSAFALVMGAAIAGMHYTAMGAARFVGTPDMVQGPGSAQLRSLALTVALATFAVLTLVALLNGLLRYRALWQRVESNEQRLQSMVDMASEAIISIDRHGCIQSFNRAAESIFGWTALEARGRNVSLLMPSLLAEQHDGYLERFHHTGQGRMMGSHHEVLGLHRNGRHLPLQLSLKKMDTPQGLRFFGFLTDLSERKKADARLRVASSVFEHSFEGILVLDPHMRIIDSNTAYELMSGHAKERCVGHTLQALYANSTLAQAFDSLAQIMSHKAHWQGEMETCDANAEKAVHRMSISTVVDEQQRVQHYIVIVSDVTQEKIHERQLEAIALYDSLTRLPNRRLLQDRMIQGMHAATRQKTLLVVLYLDLDGFKSVNDQFGHADGDLLLCIVADRLRAELRAEDTAARVGGDEMVLLLGCCTHVQQAEAVTARLLWSIAQPAKLTRGTAHVTASIGMCVFPLDANTPEELLDFADQAMYTAKQNGKNQFRRYGQPAAQTACDPRETLRAP